MDFDGYLRFLLALVFVIALIAMFAAFARRMGFGYRRTDKGSRIRRLSIVEIMPVDAKRRLVLIRRDATEHLILLGTGSDLLVEDGIAVNDFADVLAETAKPPNEHKDGTP